MNTGILICGHGSRDPDSITEFNGFVERLTRQIDYPVTHGFLEHASPSIDDAAQELRRQCQHIIIAPLLLLPGKHHTQDLPEFEARLRQAGGFESIELLTEIQLDHPQVAQCAELITSKGISASSESTLIVVGRGAGLEQAAYATKEFTEKLKLDHGYVKRETCFMGMNSPSLEECLDRHSNDAGRSLHLLPLLWFRGKLLDKIQMTLNQFSERHPQLDFKLLPHIGSHEMMFQMVLAEIKACLSKPNP